MQVPAAWADAAKGVRLLMIERDGCLYCAAWDAEVGPSYAQSPTGQVAPIVAVDIDGPYPNGLALERRPVMTPTFILLQDGIELGRVEGYAGKDQFYPLIGQLMANAGIIRR
ncbi:SoxS protein [Paracoccus sp. 11-3]|uniref:SoxS protein n=2 Tax=Paracoccus amoyensis TaxID=2760093 RepID=A0A926GHG9_9RHOB|nr:SoxS protein [Paracoccus amoyensis]